MLLSDLAAALLPQPILLETRFGPGLPNACILVLNGGRVFGGRATVPVFSLDGGRGERVLYVGAHRLQDKRSARYRTETCTDCPCLCRSACGAHSHGGLLFCSLRPSFAFRVVLKSIHALDLVRSDGQRVNVLLPHLQRRCCCQLGLI